MNWQSLASDVADIAPAIGSVLAGPAGGIAGSVLASVFGTTDDPDAVAKAIQQDPEAAAKLQAAELDHAKDMRALAIKARGQEIDAQTTQQTSINETMRAEMQARGFFKSSWRAFLGWVMGASFAAMALALSISVVRDPARMADAVGAMMMLIPAMAAVLGVNIAGNRRERETAMTGQPSNGLMDALAQRLKDHQ